MKIFRQGKRGPAKLNAPGLGRRNPLGLPLADVLPLVLSHEREDLQHQIGDEGSHQIFSLAGVQKRHVKHADVNSLLLCQHPPLLLNLHIVAAQAVYAQNIQQISPPQALDQLLVPGPEKILA